MTDVAYAERLRLPFLLTSIEGMFLADCAAAPPAVVSASAQQLGQVLVADPTALRAVPSGVVLVGRSDVVACATEDSG